MTTILHPALIIGLGGSGIAIARRFRRRLTEEYPNSPYVRVLGVDTDKQEQVTDDMPALADHEYLWTSQFDPQHYVGRNAIDQNAEIRAWWSGYDALPLRYVVSGAQQRRPVGRLAFFVHYKKIAQFLRGTIQQIFDNETYWALPPAYQHGLTIYVVASTCGGTGTGMFLDFATLARHIAKSLMPGRAVTVRGLLLMPSAFIETGQVPQNVSDALRANAFGALTEMDFMMSLRQKRSPVSYPGAEVVDREASVFDTCYLVGNQSSSGAVYTKHDEILERAATQMMVELASPLGDHGESQLDNVMSAIKATPDYRGRARLYSSFAADWLELPSKRVHKRWAKKYAMHVLSRWGRSRSGGEAVVKACLAELEKAPAFGLVRRLLDRDGVNPFLPDVGAEADLLRDIPPAGLDPSLLSQRASALEQAYRRPLGELTGQLVQLREAMSHLGEEIQRAVANAIALGSLHDARSVIDRVRADLGSWMETAKNDRGRASAGQWLSDFNQAIAGVSPGLMEKMTTNKPAYVRAQLAVVEDAIRQARSAASDDARSRIGRVVLDDGGLGAADRHATFLLGRIERASAVREVALVQCGQIVEPSIPAGMNVGVVSDADADAAFNDGERLANFDAAAREAVGALVRSDDPFRSGEALKDAFMRIGDRVVVEAKDAFLGSVPLSPEVIGDRLNRLEPFVLFTPEWVASEGHRQTHQVNLVGGPAHVTAAESAIRAHVAVERRKDAQFLQLEAPDQVIMTRQLHGFPLFGITELALCQAAYDATQASERALRFTIPEVRDGGWDIMPVSDAEGSRWFAIALAVGAVRRTGTGYAYRSETGATTPLCPGSDDRDQARRDARGSFVSSSFAAQFQIDLRNRLLRDGNEAVAATLRTWITEEDERRSQPPYPAEFAADLERVRKYYESIR